MKKKIIVNGEESNMETTKKAIDELADKAKRENADLDIFIFNPEEEFILKKETVYILVFFSALIGYLVGSVV